MEIKAKDLLKLTDIELQHYKLHLASWNGQAQPLNDYLKGWEFWVGWNEWRSSRDDFNRNYIFSLIQFYHEPNRWLFGGIFKITNRHQDWAETEVGYDLELVDLHKDLIGRLVIDFSRYQGMRGRAFKLEGFYKDFNVSEILKEPYNGINFPGYENINIDFSGLEIIFKFQKNDWKGALENVKGVYVITDKSNGKRYVGCAYGSFGIWSRWSEYVETGHGLNDELTKLISENGIEYARKNFYFSLLEYYSMKTDDNIIFKRESFWKEVLFTIGQFGYNLK